MACMSQAIDPDNTDGYQAKGGTGFGTTKADTLDFLTFLSTEARAQGLGIGLKNTLELIAGNVGLWDFFVNEQCYDWQECNYYTPAQAGERSRQCAPVVLKTAPTQQVQVHAASVSSGSAARQQ